MSISEILDRLHFRARRNKWLGRFAVFNRVALAAGFVPSGLQKVVGERFTALAVNHPMGNYLEAFHHTGYYYPFVGFMQVTAAILLLIPRTATLGAIIYFPIILNICVLSLAVRFDGSLFTAPLMVLANLYLLCWDFHKLKLVFPFNRHVGDVQLPRAEDLSNRFPKLFFCGVMIAVLIVLLNTQAYDIKPYNTISDCRTHAKSSDYPKAAAEFCDCIHLAGLPFNDCLEEYHQAIQERASRMVPKVASWQNLPAPQSQ